MEHAAPIVHQCHMEAGLRQAGVEPGSVVLVHGSLKSMGWVEGGAPTVIAAFRSVLGPGGTLVVPTLCQRDMERRFETWDIRRSPSDVGLVTETLRLMPEAFRSDHATHSVAAIGPRAEELVRDHVRACGRPSPWGPAAFGHGSPWERLHQANGRLVFLGVTLSCNTMCHYVQALLVERILDGACPSGVPHPALSQQERGKLEGEVQGWGRLGVWPSFPFADMEEALRDRGLMRYGQIGLATVRSVLAGPMVEAVLDELQRHSEKWLPGDFRGWAAKALARNGTALKQGVPP
jgi:aminoglycoside 3-N-acetyltransferase